MSPLGSESKLESLRIPRNGDRKSCEDLGILCDSRAA